MIETPILTLNETQEGVRIEAGFGQRFSYSWDLVANQQEVQAWLDLHLLNCGYYDDNNWFQPAWAMLLRPSAGLAVPGDHKRFIGIVQAPLAGHEDFRVREQRLEECGLSFIRGHNSLLWSVLRWAQAGFSDTEIRRNAYEVGLIQPCILRCQWEPIRAERADIPGLSAILRKQAEDA